MKKILAYALMSVVLMLIYVVSSDWFIGSHLLLP